VWRVVNECLSHRDELIDTDVPSQAAWWKESHAPGREDELDAIAAQLAEARAKLELIENSRRYRLACAIAAPLDRLRRARH
jgi:hypothetical protein